MNYFKKHIIYILLFIVLCFLMYFLNIGNYAFLDTDETKFVSIAKDMLNRNDWINLQLNGEKWFDSPPLLFWIINIFCLIFGKITTETVRLPISLITISGIVFLFIYTKSILTKKFALIISLIYMTSLGIITFSRLATNDMLYAVTTMIAVIFSSLILFIKTEQKYKLWLGFYIFTAFAGLSTGLFGIVIPLIVTLFIYIFSGNLKEFFKFKNIISGIAILSVITLPWYLIMIKHNGLNLIKYWLLMYRYNDYISIKTVLNVILIFFTGFLPWSFSLIWIMGSKIKEIINSAISYFKENSQDRLNEKWKKLSRIDKFLSINTIIFFISFFAALIYGGKYTYLILFLMFPASCISGVYWYEYIIKKYHDKSIFIATLIPNLLLIICSVTILFGHNYLNNFISNDIYKLIIPMIAVFFVVPVFGIFAVILKGRKQSFISNVILMTAISLILTPSFFNFMSDNGGENDLIKFANKAKQDKAKLTAFITSKKYSIIYYYDNVINFHNSTDTDWLKAYLIKNPNDYVITEIKDLWNIENKQIPYMLLDSGKRYCLIQHMPYKIQAAESKEEPEIIVY